MLQLTVPFAIFIFYSSMFLLIFFIKTLLYFDTLLKMVSLDLRLQPAKNPIRFANESLESNPMIIKEAILRIVN